jgi:hypothetical protein
MIDIFTVVVPHALMAIAIWRMIHNDDLDFDPILPGTAEALARLKRGFAPRRGGKSPDGQPPRA